MKEFKVVFSVEHDSVYLTADKFEVDENLLWFFDENQKPIATFTVANVLWAGEVSRVF